MFNHFAADLSYLSKCINYRLLPMGSYKVVVYFVTIFYLTVFNITVFTERLLQKHCEVGQDHIFTQGSFGIKMQQSKYCLNLNPLCQVKTSNTCIFQYGVYFLPDERSSDIRVYSLPSMHTCSLCQYSRILSIDTKN